MEKTEIGFIGGTGLYEIEGSKLIEEISIDTPWGNPSDKITICEIEGKTAAFLPRHGKGHKVLPHEVNARANIAALKMIGVKEIIAFSASCSLQEEVKPLDFVLPNQIIDRTKIRISSYFGYGIAGHIAFADPFCLRLHDIILPISKDMSLTMHTDKTLICMEGPAFSTRAESNLYRSWGGDVINMSTLPEAKLAREAEICYAVICMSTDYDCWHEEEEDVTIEMVFNNLKTNSGNAKQLIKSILHDLSKHDRNCECKEAAKYAIVTAPENQNPETAKKLKEILPEYF